jgi:RNA polymerase sigma factor (sigma-70 family)
LAAVPSIGRANRVEGVAPAETDLTRALYEEYANQIFRYCLHQLGSREEAEDAVQSTFLNAFRGIKRGVVPELESAWLFKIAHNVCLSRRRSSWRRGRIESPADFEVVEELTAAPVRRADELIGLQDVLEQMPESQRRAILLREWQGLSYREIAVELDLSQAAVETLIFRARRALATGLEQPPEKRKRLARALDLGNVATAVKSLLIGGSAAAKVAATVAIVSATTVVAVAPVQQHRARHAPVPAGSTSKPAPASKPTAGLTAGASTVTAPTAPAKHAARRHMHAAAVSSTVPPDDAAPPATPETVAPGAPETVAPAPTTRSEGAVGRSHHQSRPAQGSKNGAEHGKSDGANGKGPNRGLAQPRSEPPVATLPVQQVPAGSKAADHAARKAQGGGSDLDGSVDSPPTQPVPPPVSNVVGAHD